MHFPKCNTKYDALFIYNKYNWVTTQHFLENIYPYVIFQNMFGPKTMIMQHGYFFKNPTKKLLNLQPQKPNSPSSKGD